MTFLGVVSSPDSSNWLLVTDLFIGWGDKKVTAAQSPGVCFFLCIFLEFLGCKLRFLRIY